jgi:hypothetical protein
MSQYKGLIEELLPLSPRREYQQREVTKTTEDKN